jgi:hypothetical protein
MPYTSEKPKLVPDSESLKQRIAGWGVDLDPKDRPAVPMESFQPEAAGAHWKVPERQAPRYRREKSTEHAQLTPVFGTTCPPRGFSGLIRRLAYTYSEGRSAHWLLLLLADRVDVVESAVREAARGRPDNLLQEYGLRSELTGRGIRSRLGQRRADTRRIPLELAVYGGVALLAGGFLVSRRKTRARARERARRAA